MWRQKPVPPAPFASHLEMEQRYYDRVGLFLTFPRFGHLRIGGAVKAHRLKASYTALYVTMPIFLR